MTPRHHPRCRFLHDPPSLRDPSACNCGAIPPLPQPVKISKPLFRFDDRDALDEVLVAALDVVMDADLIDDNEWYGRLVSPDKMERLENALEKVHRV